MDLRAIGALATLAVLSTGPMCGPGGDASDPQPAVTASSGTATCFGDLNEDGVVNNSDALLFRDCSPCAIGCDAACDANDDGVVDGIDDQAFDNVFGSACSTCRELVFQDDCLAAAETCELELASDPQDPHLNFLRALTRVCRLRRDNGEGPDGSVFTDSVKEILTQAGFVSAGSDPYEFASHPEDFASLPSDSPSGGEVQDFLWRVPLAELTAATDQNLAPLDASFLFVASPAELAGVELQDKASPGPVNADVTVEVDHGDVKLLETVLRALRAKLLLTVADDLDEDVDGLAHLPRPIRVQQDVLDIRGSLLGLRPDGDDLRAEAHDQLEAAIDAYLAGSDFIRAESDPQGNDVFTLSAGSDAEEAAIRQDLLDLRDALSSPTHTALCNQQVLVDLEMFFDPALDLRGQLPVVAFDETANPDNFIEPDTFPDPTFGGVFPDFTQQDLTALVAACGGFPGSVVP